VSTTFNARNKTQKYVSILPGLSHNGVKIEVTDLFYCEIYCPVKKKKIVSVDLNKQMLHDWIIIAVNVGTEHEE